MSIPVEHAIGCGYPDCPCVCGVHPEPPVCDVDPGCLKQGPHAHGRAEANPPPERGRMSDEEFEILCTGVGIRNAIGALDGGTLSQIVREARRARESEAAAIASKTIVYSSKIEEQLAAKDAERDALKKDIERLVREIAADAEEVKRLRLGIWEITSASSIAEAWRIARNILAAQETEG